MARYFDEQAFSEALTHKDWYLDLYPQYERFVKSPDAAEEFYAFIERKLAAGEIALGATGPDWDRERAALDTVVVHHTHCPSGITRERLSAMHLVRLYAANYASPAPSDYHVQGDAIYSGHFWEGRQVFYAYHWIVRMDGTAERLLADDELGWHAGSWDVNCRSVGIVLDNDCEETPPPQGVIAALSSLIRKEYPRVSSGRIMGHREVNPKTTCPGNGFLDGWKRRVLDRV